MSKRIVHELDFEKEGAHVALVSQGANQQSVLLMKQKKELKKSEDIQITTSMATFLTTFFYMYHEDANELAELLGFEPTDWVYNIIGEDTSVTVLKSYSDGDKISQDLYEKIEKMGVEFTQLIKKEKEMKKTKEELKKEEAALQKSIDDAVKVAVKVALEKADVEKGVALKAKDTEIADLKKAEDTRVKDGYVELCKGYSFVEDADVLADTLFKCKGIEGFNIILDTLEKARTAIAGELEGELGTDQEKVLKKEDVPDHLTKTAELIKARHGKKENK